MTVKLGDAVALTLNGTRYKVVKDVEPQINKGGKSASEAQEYGDGTADPYFVNSAGGITGLKVVVEEENADAFEKALGLNSMSVVLECVSKSYECTGFVVGDVTISATKRTTSEFDIKVSDGGGVRES
ncbi:hypothetical protein IJX73_02925 [bacterium]|nr:hypothetical protein [bacterium]